MPDGSGMGGFEGNVGELGLAPVTRPADHARQGGPELGPARLVAPLQPSDPTRVGTYQIVGLIGRGGMGSVYLGRSATGRLVAVKVVRADLAADPEFLRLFDREARLARRVARFCTAEVLDGGEDGGQPFLVTEYVDGPTLWDTVVRRGPLGDAYLERIAVATATALTAIHGAGMVHRDLKPSNVMLSSAGPLVIDFGIAHALDGTTQLTQEAAGTPAFMAPEQARGERVGPAADVFAWGGVVVFAATGQPPFGTGRADALLYRVVHERPNLDGVPEPLRSIVSEAMHADPAGRPTAHQLYARLLGNPAVTVAGQAGVVHPMERADRAAPEERSAEPGAPRNTYGAPPPTGTTAGAPSGPGHRVRSGRPDGGSSGDRPLRAEPGTSIEDADDGWSPSRGIRKPARRDRPSLRQPAPDRPIALLTDNLDIDDDVDPDDDAADDLGLHRWSATGPQRATRHRRGRSAFDSAEDGADEFDDMVDAEAAPTGFLTKLRHGWVGPVLVVSVVSLVAVLLYVMLGPSDGAATPTPSMPTPSMTPRQANPEAAAGTAMADGTYRCWVRTEQANAAATMEFIGYLLEVPRGAGQYVWDGQPGTYEIVRSPLSKDQDVWGDVTFTSGPLQNVKAQSIATFPDASGIVSEVVVLFKDGSGRNCLVTQATDPPSPG